MSALPPEIPERFSRHLIRSERIVVAVRRHPVKMVEPVLSAVAALAVVLWIQTRLSRDVPIIPDVLWLLWLAVLLRALWRLYDWSRDWFVVTDRRLMLNYGVLTRRVAMMPMAKVTDMSFNRSILGRILGYGEFVLESAGQDQALRSVPWLPNPDTLYRLICAELFGTPDDVADVELDLPPVDDPRGPRVPSPVLHPPSLPREDHSWPGFRLGPGGDDDPGGRRYDTDVIQVGHEIDSGAGSPDDGHPDHGQDDEPWDDEGWVEDAAWDGEDRDDGEPLPDSLWDDDRADDRQDGGWGDEQDDEEDDDGGEHGGRAGAQHTGRDPRQAAMNGQRRSRRRGLLGVWDRLDPLAGPRSSARPVPPPQRSSWWAWLDPRGRRR